MYCRGIRGATTVDANQADAILSATRDLIEAIVFANGLRPEDIASVFFTTTPDLDAAFPAQAARELGWRDTALMCSHEMSVPGSLPRVLISMRLGAISCSARSIRSAPRTRMNRSSRMRSGR